MISKTKTNCLTCTRRSDCFNILTNSELSFFNKNRILMHYKKGEIICKQGTFAQSIMYLYSGLAKIYIESKTKDLILNVIPEGDMIGLPSLFADNLYHYTAKALEDSVVCLIDAEVFKKQIQRNALFASEIINVLNKTSIQGFKRFISLTQKQLHGRFADILLHLITEIYGNTTFKLSLSRKDLAELTGMSTESIVRVIREFRQANILKVSGKSFEILDMEALQRISETG